MQTSLSATLRDISFDFQADDLTQAVFKTLAYFDVFDFPLTAWEVYRYLWRPGSEDSISFLTVQRILDSGVYGITAREGFYMLSGRGALVSLRKTRAALAAKKYRRAGRTAAFLRLCPFVRLVAVSNSLALANVRADSDIDLFIITAKDKIWLARFFTAGFLKLCGLRPTPVRKRDTICLNFFVSEEALNLKNLRKSGLVPDIYFTYWVRQLVPLYDAGDIFSQFMQSNGWVANYIGAADGIRPNIRRRIGRHGVLEFCKTGGEFLLCARVIERFCKKLQLRQLPPALAEKANRSTDVVITDSVLKFHERDRRNEYRKRWLDKQCNNVTM
ncbi:MAG: hypothetical protein WC310_05345 [Patescibacteria group bacterium]|jgi:hypothetical protein